MKKVLLLFGLLIMTMSQLSGQSPTPAVSQTVSPTPQPSQSPVASASTSPLVSASPRATRKFESQALKFQPPPKVVPMISPSASPSPKPTSRHKKDEKGDGKDAKKSTPVPEQW